MNRRGFLARLLGVGVVAATDPSALLAAPFEAPPALSEATVAASGRLAGAGLLVSSGGLCAPITPYYNLRFDASSKPLRDALPKFNADRKDPPE